MVTNYDFLFPDIYPSQCYLFLSNPDVILNIISAYTQIGMHQAIYIKLVRNTTPYMLR